MQMPNALGARLNTNAQSTGTGSLDAGLLEDAIANALAIVDRNRANFAAWFPDDTTVHARYLPRNGNGDWRDGGWQDGSNVGWTTGFVPGVDWLAWELSGEANFRTAAEQLMTSFVQRMDALQDVDTHDLGFLYTLSSVTPWRLTGNTEGRRAALDAADYLMTRFLEPAGIIQAWGNLDDPRQRGRTIIDSLMNMPLLYWASAESGDGRFAAAAKRHTAQLRDNIFRTENGADNGTFHTFYWDLETGAPLRGVTAQGYSDDSTWARGQAWGIYGFALNYRYGSDATFLAAATRCADYFLAHLPADSVPYWDLAFGDESGSAEPRDSSAGAIAVCGLLELAQWFSDGEQKTRYQVAAATILASLIRNYAPAHGQASDALLLHGVYSKPEGKGVDEGNLWGDYFYLEALMRMHNPDWTLYW